MEWRANLFLDIIRLSKPILSNLEVSEPEARESNHLEYPDVFAGVHVAAVDGREALVAGVHHGADGEDLEVAPPDPRDLREMERRKSVSERERGTHSFTFSLFLSCLEVICGRRRSEPLNSLRH